MKGKNIKFLVKKMAEAHPLRIASSSAIALSASKQSLNSVAPKESSKNLVNSSVTVRRNSNYHYIKPVTAAPALSAAQSISSGFPSLSFDYPISTEVIAISPVDTKYSLQKFRDTENVFKSELKELNEKFKNYVSNSRRLEAENRQLLAQVEQLRSSFKPGHFPERDQLERKFDSIYAEIKQLRIQTSVMILKADNEEKYSEHLGLELKNAELEHERIKLDLDLLQRKLAESKDKREYFLNQTNSIESEHRQLKEEFLRAESEHIKLFDSQANLREDIKKLTHVNRTYLDMLSFHKQVLGEEMRQMHEFYSNSNNKNGFDMRSFWEAELELAKRQIKADFKDLNKRKMDEFRAYKEEELKRIAEKVEEERLHFSRTQSEVSSFVVSPELQTPESLRSELQKNQIEFNELKSINNQLLVKESNLQSKLDDLRQRNSEKLKYLLIQIEQTRNDNLYYEYELDFWERVDKLRLDGEIQAYRSILSSENRTLSSFEQNLPQHANTRPAPIHQVPSDAELIDRYSSLIDQALDERFKDHISNLTNKHGSQISLNSNNKRPVVDYNKSNLTKLPSTNHGSQVSLASSRYPSEYGKETILNVSSAPNDNTKDIQKPEHVLSITKPVVQTSQNSSNDDLSSTTKIFSPNVNETSASSSIIRGATNFEDRVYFSNRSTLETIYGMVLFLLY